MLAFFEKDQFGDYTKLTVDVPVKKLKQYFATNTGKPMDKGEVLENWDKLDEQAQANLRNFVVEFWTELDKEDWKKGRKSHEEFDVTVRTLLESSTSRIGILRNRIEE